MRCFLAAVAAFSTLGSSVSAQRSDNRWADNRAACSVYVAAFGGSDSNPGTSAKPFATLSHTQAVIQRASPTSKVACLKAGSGGSYNNVTISLARADAGETWETDPASPFNSAILDGANSTQDGIHIGNSNFAATSNITINGIKLQRYKRWSIIAYNAPGTIIENNEVCCMTVAPPVENASASVGINVGDHVLVSHNYVHDTASTGIASLAYQEGSSIDGTVIDSNVLIDNAQLTSDASAIGIDMHATANSGGRVAITNNFIRDWGGSGYTSLRAIYLDDDASNVTITGNIVGPPSINVNSGYIEAFFINGGDLNTISGNVVDVLRSTMYIAVWQNNKGSGASIPMTWTGPNTFTGNVVLANYPGLLKTNDGSVPGVVYEQANRFPSGYLTIENNLYYNYGGGATPSNGNLFGDTNPIVQSPLCSGYLYALAISSPAHRPPASFPGILGNWGPPGFTVPSSTNRSCPG